MSSGERPIGAAKGRQIKTMALCQHPPPPNPEYDTALSQCEGTAECAPASVGMHQECALRRAVGGMQIRILFSGPPMHKAVRS